MKQKPYSLQKLLFWLWALLGAIYAIFGIAPATAAHAAQWNAWFFTCSAILISLLAVAAGIKMRNTPEKYMPYLNCVFVPVYVSSIAALLFDVRLTLPALCFWGLFWTAAAYSGLCLFTNAQNFLPFAALGASIQAWCASWTFLVFVFWGLAASVYIIIGLVFFTLWFCSSGIFGFFIWLAAIIFFLLFTMSCFYFFKTYVWDSFSTFLKTAESICKNKKQKYVLSLMTLFAITLVFFIAPQENRFDAIELLSAHNISEKQKKEFLSNIDRYKQRLTEIYMAPFFFSIDGANAKSVFSSSRLSGNANVPLLHDFSIQLFRPFVYCGSSKGMEHDQALAAELYASLFGAPIETAEKERIAHISGDQVSETKQPAARPQNNVHVAQQEVTVWENGEWADIEIHETYRNNRSYSNEEVVFYYQLPPGTVITGLWLSDTPEKKFEAVVSPRGAAQKTFNKIVQRGQDPALAEQVGPNTYRVRVFPIPSNKIHTASGNGSAMHMWLRLRSLKQDGAAWVLPKATRTQNVYKDEQSRILVNGRPAPTGKSWLPSSVPVRHSSPPTRQTIIAGNKEVILEPRIGAAGKTPCEIDVFIDTSFAMHAHTEALLRSINEIDALCGGKGVTYHTWDNEWRPFNELPAKRLHDYPFWGRFSISDVSTGSLPKGTANKTPIILTQSARFGFSPLTDVTLPQGVRFLFVDGKRPDVVGDAVQQKTLEAEGGLDETAASALNAARLLAMRRGDPAILNCDARYIWRLGGKSARTDMDPLAAHILIAHTAQEGGAKTTADLDALQKLAVAGHVVTPYSSMIVLVEEWQRAMLKQAEQEKERFSRQKESPAAALPMTPRKMQRSSKYLPDITASAVPEPEEWALIIVGSCMLLYMAYKRRMETGCRHR